MFTLKSSNSGLQDYQQQLFNDNPWILNRPVIQVRSEDIPIWLEEYSGLNKPAIGVCGEDLYVNYKISNSQTAVRKLVTYPWYDESAVYNKPALCLIGKGPQQHCMDQCTISVAVKYLNLAKKYIFNKFGKNVEILPLNGGVEQSITEQIADFAIDIVYTGTTIEQLDLCVIDTIFKSDIVLLGSSAL